MKFLPDFVLAHEGPGKAHEFGMSEAVASGFILFFILVMIVYLIKKYKK